jgi:hypothetical protein
MSKFFDVPSRRVKMATLTLGSGLNADADTRIDLTGFDGWRPAKSNRKAVLLALELEVSGDFATTDGSAKLGNLFLNYMLDPTSLKGPGGVELINPTSRGWHRPFYNYMQQGEMRGLFTRDIAANSSGSLAHHTRTMNMFLDFVEHRSPDPYARCWPAECFFTKGTGAEFIVKMKSAAQILFLSSAAVHLSFPSGTLTVYAHLSDVPANRLRIPSMLLERAINGDSRTNPTPGPGAYTRLLIANSPAPADNPGGEDDDLSDYTQIDYFGYAGNYGIWKEDVAGYVQRVSDEISEEPRPQLDDPTSYRSDAYILNPLSNFDGHLRALVLQYLRSGDTLSASRVYADEPKLGANGDSRTNLPQAINFITQEPIARTSGMMSAILSTITRASNGQPLNRTPILDPRYKSADPSRSPWIVDAS